MRTSSITTLQNRQDKHTHEFISFHTYCYIYTVSLYTPVSLLDVMCVCVCTTVYRQQFYEAEFLSPQHRLPCRRTTPHTRFQPGRNFE